MITLDIPEVGDTKQGKESLKEFRKAIKSGYSFLPVMTGSLKMGLAMRLMAVIPFEAVRYLDGHLVCYLETSGVKALRDACDEMILDEDDDDEDEEPEFDSHV